MASVCSLSYKVILTFFGKETRGRSVLFRENLFTKYEEQLMSLVARYSAEKNPRMSEGFKFYGVDGIGLPVVLLTQNACRPDSRFLPFAERNCHRLKQKHRCVFLIPTRHQAVGVARYSAEKNPRISEGFKFYGVDGIRTRGLCLDRAAC